LSTQAGVLGNEESPSKGPSKVTVKSEPKTDAERRRDAENELAALNAKARVAQLKKDIAETYKKVSPSARPAFAWEWDVDFTDKDLVNHYSRKFYPLDVKDLWLVYETVCIENEIRELEGTETYILPKLNFDKVSILPDVHQAEVEALKKLRPRRGKKLEHAMSLADPWDLDLSALDQSRAADEIYERVAMHTLKLKRILPCRLAGIWVEKYHHDSSNDDDDKERTDKDDVR